MWTRFGLRIFWRVFFALVIFGIGAGTAFYFREDLILWLLIPADGKLSPFDGGLPVFSRPTGALQATFGVAGRAGLVLAYPFAVYFTYTLIKPVLSTPYRRVFYVFIPASTILAVGGIAFAYYVVMPVMLQFLLRFSEGIAVPLIAIDEYLNLLFSMVFWFGVIFQIPLVMLLLTKLRIGGYQQFSKRRRLVASFSLILSAILTPTFDGFSMLLMAVPMYVLYEVGLLLSWAARPEEGNYFFLKTIWRGIDWYLNKVEVVIKSPYTVPRWMFRKVLRRDKKIEQRSEQRGEEMPPGWPIESLRKRIQGNIEKEKKQMTTEESPLVVEVPAEAEPVPAPVDPMSRINARLAELQSQRLAADLEVDAAREAVIAAESRRNALQEQITKIQSALEGINDLLEDG